MRLIDADELRVDYIVPRTSTGTTCEEYVSLKQIMYAPRLNQAIDITDECIEKIADAVIRKMQLNGDDGK